MFYEEKLEYLKAKYAPTDFRVPFKDWPEILKKIESKYITKTDLNDHFTNWAGNLKNKTIVKTIARNEIQSEMNKLDVTNNYWVVLVTDTSPMANHHVYDCKPISMLDLLSLATTDFFIIEKKYNWFTYFQFDQAKQEIAIYKSGTKQIPFEQYRIKG
jgi:hypothetical protein